MGLWVTKSPFPTNEREDTQGASRRYEGACTQLVCSRSAAGSEMSEGALPECLELGRSFPAGLASPCPAGTLHPITQLVPW